ncbi:type IV secretion system DNA-binding domain-containing protein [Paraburkholderia aspalathi]|nr:type IV secretion system DNA-binding domain-containing protein [Paraburkholderia aspalathi]MBK3780400.1 type IV secretion system DNA-binding domain-containing protein [Paraburkholderia aspalathi]
MNDSILSLLDSEPARLLVFGFTLYALFTIWRKLAARWVNWFPLAAKLTRGVLYAAAVGVVVLGFRAMPTTLAPAEAMAWLAIGAGAAPVLNLLARRLRPREKLRRGAAVGKPRDVNRQSASELPKADFTDSVTIGGVNIPRSVEPYHFLVVGSTGTGKSVAITRLLDEIEARGDLAIIVDSGGESAARYYREGRDHILNPFDDRCTPWSPTAEMKGPWDAEALSKSMIPDGEGDNKDWNSYAQTFVTSVLRKLDDQRRLSIKTLLYYVQAAPISELEPFLAGTAAASQLVSDRTFGSIRTIAANFLATYAYLQDHDDPFSVAQFIRAERPGFLFLSYRDDQIDSLRNMIACVLDVASRTVLSLPDSTTRRVWLIIDEFASIGKVQSIETFAAKARKKGGCLLLGMQSVSQLQKTYGDKGAQTILSNLSSWLVLRCSDAETAEYISTYIGEKEISRMMRGEQSSDSGGSSGLNEQVQTERAVMPVQVQRLKDRTGFFKLSGDYAICRIKLDFPKKRGRVAEQYAERDFKLKPMLDLLPAAPAVAAQEGPAAQMSSAPVAEKAPVDASQSPAAQTEAPAAVPRGPLKIVKNPFEVGPEALEEVLTELADAFENEA